MSSPLDSESDLVEILQDFFSELKGTPQWRNQLDALNAIEAKLVDESFDLDGIRGIKEITWEQWSFKAGLLGRVQRAAKQYKKNRHGGS